MKIEMTRDYHVAEDGFTVKLWPEGSVHDTRDQLAGDLIGAGVARPVVGHFVEGVSENSESALPKRRGRPPKDRT